MHLPFRRLVALSALTAVSLTTATLAAAQESPDELRQQRREVQEQQADQQVLADALSADAAVLAEELDKLAAQVDAQQAALDAAQRRVDAAEQAEVQAAADIADLQAEMADTEALLREAAVRTFTGFQGPGRSSLAFSSDPWSFAREEALMSYGTGSTTEIIDDLRALGAQLEARQREAEAHTAEVAAERETVAAAKAELDASYALQEEALNAVEDRLDAKLAEVASLEALDADLARQIKAEEQRIADAIAARNRARSSGTIPANAPVELTTVRGIVVNVAIADNVEGILAAMAAKGYTLGGGGYRSSDSQIRLRRAHCGTSDYAIWQMPAYKCRPPTARPGRSAHERGLAIDFTYNGRALRSRNSDVWRALNEVAGQFGFKNLPSEPWHWSTDGT